MGVAVLIHGNPHCCALHCLGGVGYPCGERCHSPAGIGTQGAALTCRLGEPAAMGRTATAGCWAGFAAGFGHVNRGLLILDTPGAAKATVTIGVAVEGAACCPASPMLERLGDLLKVVGGHKVMGTVAVMPGVAMVRWPVVGECARRSGDKVAFGDVCEGNCCRDADFTSNPGNGGLGTPGDAVLSCLGQSC
mmetsp:Transcript_49572/g.111365  ORF Transcript_49572/g.111365 Transcript_49572/m.111365 type:complete len:192 (-) Transcript_49572:2879-3454(-)